MNISRGTRPALGGQRAAQSLPSLPSILLMSVFALYFVLPVWWLIVSVTKSTKEFTSTPALWFTPDAISNFLANLSGLVTYSDGIFVRWIFNSIGYAFAGALVGTLLSAMCGFALAKYSFRGREGIFNAILAGVLVPTTALALPLYLLFSQVSLTNTFWAVFIPNIVSPFGVYLARIYAQSSVPEELLEAARLDGAGEVRTFFALVTRLMAPALVTIFLFQFVGIWNDFFLPLIMLRDQGLFPVTLGLYNWNSNITMVPQLRSLVIVGSFVSIIPLIFAFLSLQRFWSSGLGAGSVK